MKYNAFFVGWVIEENVDHLLCCQNYVACNGVTEMLARLLNRRNKYASSIISETMEIERK